MTVIKPVSYDWAGAAAATGLSVDLIRRAYRAGDLTVRYPRIAGAQVRKPVIEYAELERWISAGDTERQAS